MKQKAWIKFAIDRTKSHSILQSKHGSRWMTQRLFKKFLVYLNFFKTFNILGH